LSVLLCDRRTHRDRQECPSYKNPGRGARSAHSVLVECRQGFLINHNRAKTSKIRVYLKHE